MLMQARYVLAAAASLAYVAGSQWLMTSAPPSSWNAVALLAPMLLAVGVWAWRARQRLLSLGALAVIVVLAVRAARGGDMAAEPLYLAQHVAIHACLALWFGATLRPGLTPLISRFAERVHRQLTPAMRAYTRNVTLAWTIYFVLMGALSLVLYAGAPFDTWATFANLLTPLAVALMFAGEYLLRYRLHPDFERVSMLDAVRAYMHPGPPPASLPPDPGAR
jgi:uncharacterized membrane protein